ncbi:MAG: four helix bundle protein [Terracidiphilus sp.]
MEGKIAAKSFRELIVWQRSIQLATTIYQLSRGFPKDEIYGLASQIRRAAVSVPSNIAEGQGRLSTGEFRQFLGIARGSNFELQTQLEIARSMKIGDPKLIDQAEGLSHEVGKMIQAILERTTHRTAVTDH